MHRFLCTKCHKFKSKFGGPAFQLRKSLKSKEFCLCLSVKYTILNLNLIIVAHLFEENSKYFAESGRLPALRMYDKLYIVQLNESSKTFDRNRSF